MKKPYYALIFNNLSNLNLELVINESLLKFSYLFPFTFHKSIEPEKQKFKYYFIFLQNEFKYEEIKKFYLKLETGEEIFPNNILRFYNYEIFSYNIKKYRESVEYFDSFEKFIDKK